MLSYTLDDFSRVKNEGIVYTLDKTISDTIKAIAEEVGNPEYNKTPQFTKNHHHYIKYNSAKQFPANLKITKKTSKVGIEITIDSIRKYLNKLSDKTYDKLSGKIVDEIQVIMDSRNVSECTTNGDDAKDDSIIKTNMQIIGNEIFKIASSGTFYSEMYARLYFLLMSKFDIMKTIFTENFTTFRDVFYNIEYADPNKDYDAFCENNKANQKRRALALFYVNLMKLGTITHNEIIDIICEVQAYMKITIMKENSTSIVDELSEVLFILVTSSKKELNTHDCWGGIVENIIEISNTKSKTRPSCTPKTIFKHLDIVDNIMKT
tara:strand:- start:2061 stop:3023 length:963 start_codon:yes stop_codon:yes gene_type:complete